VYQAFPSLHRGSLAITLTVPLSYNNYKINNIFLIFNQAWEPTKIIPDLGNTALLGFVHGNDGGLYGVLVLGPGLVGSIHQGKGSTHSLS